ncbi:MAG: FAD binding domain-containing protein, partial [Elusimicrobia bacterium]|nr:FAD binding domain-containing protein [Elusimicrobiota bacterium]
CSSQLIRNMATVGGNIARPNAFNVLPPVFTALDAVVRVETGTGQKNFGLEDIYSDDFKYALGRDSIIKEVVIPAKTRNWKCAFEKFAKTLSCWESYVTLVSALDIKGGIVLTARFVLGALAARPVRVKSAERAITGRKLSAETAESAVNALACEMDGMRIPPNHLEFKKQIAVSILKKFLIYVR